MKCPLFIMNDTRAQLGEETEVGDCIKEECAWWDIPHDRCGVVLVGDELSSIQWELQELREMMPHEGQSRRW